MKDKQVALMLLRLTHATRFCHVIRTTHPDITADACVVMDTITLAGLRKIINVALMSDIQIKQAMLPIKKGGLGLLCTYDIRIAAYAESLAQCFKDLCNLETNHWPSIAAGIFTNQGPNSETKAILDETEAAFNEGLRDKGKMRKYTRFRQNQDEEVDDSIAPSSFEFPQIDTIKTATSNTAEFF